MSNPRLVDSVVAFDPTEAHAIAKDLVAVELGVSIERGLAAAEVVERRERFGANDLSTASTRPLYRRVLAQFQNSLVLVLLAAAVVSGVVLGEWIDAGVISAIVLINATIGVLQEGRAERALERLADLSAPTATVRRDGAARIVQSSEVVVGDVLILEVGARIAADARLTEAVHLQADESLLTGESTLAHKSVDPVHDAAIAAERTNIAFAGTTIRAGRGEAVVVATGRSTEFGKVVDMLEHEEPKTPLAIELDRVGGKIALLSLVLSLGIFALGVARDIAVETMFLTAVAVAVAAIPEGLSAVVTMTLSQGVWIMADQNAIVRRLPAVEALGAATVICTDKTGTLTENRMKVHEVWFLGTESTNDGRLGLAANIAVRCNDAQLPAPGETEAVGDPTEIALLDFGEPQVGSTGVVDEPRVDEIAFDSDRKRMTTFHQRPNEFFAYTKGAPEVVIGLCSFVASGDGVRTLNDSDRQKILSVAHEFAGRGLRVLALAYRHFPDLPEPLEHAESDEVFVGLVAMSDAIRPEAADAVRRAKRAGLSVVMITGDHLDTAEAVGRELGLLSSEQKGLEGRELREMSANQLEIAVTDVPVYARVEPSDKLDIVRAWRSNGAVVAMTGDGINDAPALRAADIGIAMGSGTAVAQEASGLVLADDNFATIVGAIEQGRRIFQNISRVVYFLLSANVSEIFVMATALLFFTSVGEPLLATQLLWINLVTDSFPALALGAERSTNDMLAGPSITDRSILSAHRLRRLLWQGSILGVCALGAFAISLLWRNADADHARTVLFTSLVLVQVPHPYSIRSEKRFGRYTPGASPWLAVAGLISILLQIFVVHTTIGQTLLSTTPMDALDWGLAVGAAALSALLVRVVLFAGGPRHYVALGEPTPRWGVARTAGRIVTGNK